MCSGIIVFEGYIPPRTNGCGAPLKDCLAAVLKCGAEESQSAYRGLCHSKQARLSTCTGMLGWMDVIVSFAWEYEQLWVLLNSWGMYHTTTTLVSGCNIWTLISQDPSMIVPQLHSACTVSLCSVMRPTSWGIPHCTGWKLSSHWQMVLDHGHWWSLYINYVTAGFSFQVSQMFEGVLIWSDIPVWTHGG